MRRFFARLHSFLRPGRAESEMSREMQAHLDLLREHFESRGLPPSEADLAARREYGGIELAKDRHRDERSFPFLEETRRDLRLAARSLAHAPGFTMAAVVALALGIGVNAALFITYNAVALKPLPVFDPDRVVRVERWFASNSLGDIQYAFSVPEYAQIRDRTSRFAAVVASSWPVRVNASVPDGRLSGQLVSANYFSDLGIALQFGRGFRPDEGQAGANPVIVLSCDAWQRHFLGDPGILGRSVILNNGAYTVIGVTSREFSGTLLAPYTPDFWAVLAAQPRLVPGADWSADPKLVSVQLLGRMRPGDSQRRAEAETDAVLRRFAAQYPQHDVTTSVTLQRTALFGNTEDPSFRAMVAGMMLLVGLVLLVACANVADMLLARGAFRQREIAIRMAIGASRYRVVRQLLAESIVLALLGGGAGLAISLLAAAPLWREVEQVVNPPALGIVLHVNLAPDWRVFAYVLGLSIVTGVVFGLSPALQFSRTDLGSSIKDEGTSVDRRLSRSRLRSLLIGAQVAVSTMLIITSGFLVRGLIRSRAAQPGFETRRVYLVVTDSGPDLRLAERLRLVPGVRNSAVGGGPLMGTWTPPITVTGPHGKLAGRTLASGATDNYFDTLGIPLLRGRNFTRAEIEHPASVAVISESAARQFWPATEPVGQRFTLDLDFHGKLADFQVIGIVKDIRGANLTRLDPAHVYLPIREEQRNNQILLRADGDPQRIQQAVRSAVEAYQRKPAPDVKMVSLEEGPLKVHRMLSSASATCASILALLAELVAGIGIYGVMAFLVGRRSREIGIRMALGASPAAVLRSVVLQCLRPVSVGMIIGFALAAVISALLHGMLSFPGALDFFYGIPFYDPATLLGFGGMVILVAALASSVPARRAICIDPVATLRHE